MRQDRSDLPQAQDLTPLGKTNEGLRVGEDLYCTDLYCTDLYCTAGKYHVVRLTRTNTNTSIQADDNKFSAANILTHRDVNRISQ